MRKSHKNLILKALSRKKAISTDQLLDTGVTRSDKYAISRSIKQIIDSGLADSICSEIGTYLRITALGKHKVNTLELSSSTSPIPAAWDGFWRIIMLDLPEERKSEREALRYLLKKAGFLMIKNSVWVSPYPFEHLFINIKKDLGLSTEMMVIVTRFLDPDTLRSLTKTFNINFNIKE